MIGEKIHQALLSDYAAEEKRKYIGMSQMGYCALKLYRQFRREEKTTLDSDTLLKFAVGSAMHKDILSRLWQHRGEFPYKWIKSEKECSIGNILGHADLVVEIDGEPVVIDFKIVSENAFRYATEASQHYKDQLYLYATALNIKKCLLVYVNKDDGKFKEYAFELDKDRTEYLIQKFGFIMFADSEDYIIERKGVFAQPEADWECNYCQYRSECEKSFSIEQKSGVLEIPEAIENELEIIDESISQSEFVRDELKNKLEMMLNGANGRGKKYTATFTPESVSVSYPKAKLEKLIAPEVLDQCKTEITKKGYYTIRKSKAQ